MRRGLIWGTYLGGSDSDGGRDIAVDRGGTVWVTGDTNSDDFPIKNGFAAARPGGDSDGFLVRISRSGRLKWSSYIGGSDEDDAMALCTDKMGDVYVTGETSSSDFPLVGDSGLPDAPCGYVMKIDHAGRPQWTSFFITGRDLEGNPFLPTGITAINRDAVWVGYGFR